MNASQILHMALTWALAHPAVTWPVLTALVTMTLKPRTPEQYAAMASMRPVWFWSRFAALLQLIAALGLDPIKAMKVLRKLLTGDSDPPPPPVGPTAVAVGLLFVVGLGASGCALFTPTNVHKAEVIAADTALCLVSHQDLSDEQALLLCGVAELDKILATKQLHAMREETSRHALAAANIAAHDAKLGCGK